MTIPFVIFQPGLPLGFIVNQFCSMIIEEKYVSGGAVRGLSGTYSFSALNIAVILRPRCDIQDGKA